MRSHTLIAATCGLVGFSALAIGNWPGTRAWAHLADEPNDEAGRAVMNAVDKLVVDWPLGGRLVAEVLALVSWLVVGPR